jgi:hypothetical protein
MLQDTRRWPTKLARKSVGQIDQLPGARTIVHMVALLAVAPAVAVNPP